MAVNDEDTEILPFVKDKSSPDHIKRREHAQLWLQPTFYILICLVLVSFNIHLYRENLRLKALERNKGFTGVHTLGETWDQFHTYSAYSDVNSSISDTAWETLTHTNGFVAIPHSVAAEVGLPLAEDFPDDQTKGVYVLSGFHQLHCVMYLRDTIRELMDREQAGSEERQGWSREKLVHINHCYDALRQEIQCRADDTPLYAPFKSKLTGDGQFRRCRSWSALKAWAEEHTACWPTGHCADLVK